MGKILVHGDIPDSMKAIVVAEEVLGLAKPRFKLNQYFRTIPLGSRRRASIPIGTRLVGQEKVPQFVEAEIDANAFVDLDFECHKDVVHVAVSVEAELESKQNLMQIATRDAGNALARIGNKQQAEQMCGSEMTEIAATHAWGTKAATYPIEDIMDAIDAIATNDYLPNVIIMALDTYKAFATNPQVTDVYERGKSVQSGIIPSVIGLKIDINPKITSESAVVLDTFAPAMALGDGPTVISRYSGGAKFFDGYAIADFKDYHVALVDAGRELTSCVT